MYMKEYSWMFPAEILQATPKRFPAQRIPLSFEARGADSSDSSESILLRMCSFGAENPRFPLHFLQSLVEAWSKHGGNMWEHGSARDLHSSTCWSLETFSFCSTASLFVKSSNYWAGDNDKPTFALRFLLAKCQGSSWIEANSLSEHPLEVCSKVEKITNFKTGPQHHLDAYCGLSGEQHLDIGKPMMNGECHASAAQLPSLYTASRLRHLTTETLLRHTAIPWHAALLQRIGV